MSYILDALRRAEAERERGQLPGLHSQPLGASGAAPHATSRSLVGIAAAVAALVLAAAVGWWWWSDPRPTATVGVAAPAATVPTPPAAPTTAPVVATAPVTGPAPSPAAAPVPGPVAGPVASPAPSEPPRPAPSREPVARSTPAVTSAATSRPSAASTGQAAPAKASAPSAASAPAAGSARVPALAELPADLRAQLPRLVLTGLVPSPYPAQRMLILDGQLVREGDQPAPGLLLEEIRPQAAVFSFRGQRFSLTQ